MEKIILKCGVQNKKGLLKSLKELEIFFKKCQASGFQPECEMNGKSLRHRHEFNNLESIEVFESQRLVEEDWDYITQTEYTLKEINKCIQALEVVQGDYNISLQIIWKMCGGIKLNLYHAK